MVKPILWYTLEIAALCQRSQAVPVVLGLNTEFLVAMKNAMTLIVTKGGSIEGKIASEGCQTPLMTYCRKIGVIYSRIQIVLHGVILRQILVQKNSHGTTAH